MSDVPRVIAVIPCFHEVGRIGKVATAVAASGLPVVVVDDGSADGTYEEACTTPATVLRHEVNKGKGAALSTGFTYALAHGYDASVTLDGDGQHLPTEIARFIERFARGGCDMIVGTRMGNTADMPFVRRQTNRFMSWLLSRELGQPVHDTQCGFRLLSRKAMELSIGCKTGGYSAESEILLQLALAGMKIAEVPVSTIYGDEKSKIHPVRDTIRFFRMLLHFRAERRAAGRRGGTGAV